MTIWGCKTNLVKDDTNNIKMREALLAQYPDAIELDRNPTKYETYVHGTGYVKDTEQEETEQAETARIEEIEAAKVSSGLKEITIEQGNEWILARLKQAQLSVQDATTVAKCKTAMNQILLAIKDIHEKELPYILK